MTAIKSSSVKRLELRSIQAVALLETMRDGVLPGIAQLDNSKTNSRSNGRPRCREVDVVNGLINSIGFDGFVFVDSEAMQRNVKEFGREKLVPV